MSLVICSNQPDDDLISTESSVFEPWSFRNSLSSTYQVPKDAQVALQSCKYNLDGSVDLAKNNEVYYQYTGENLGVGETMDKSTALPIKTTLETGSSVSELSIEQLASKIQDSMNEKVYHPMLRDLCECSVSRDATTSAFEGYTFKYKNNETLTSVVPADNKALDGLILDNRLGLPLGSEPLWTYTGGRFSTVDAMPFVQSVILADKPVSTFTGKMKFSIDAINKAVNFWGVGATRFVYNADSNGDFCVPEYFNGDTLWPADSQSQDQDFMCDFFVYQDPVTGELKLAHAVADSTLEVLKTSMRDVDYTNNVNSDYYTLPRYDIATNADRFTSISIEFVNQRVNVYLDKTGTRKIVLEYEADNKESNFKPINQSCWDLFPFMFLNTEDTSFSNSITFDGVDQCSWIKDYYDFDMFKDPTNGSWYNLMETIGEEEDSLLIETRPWNDYGTAIVITHKGLIASPNKFLHITNALIVSPSTQYSLSDDANTAKLFGFSNQSVVIFPDASPDLSKSTTSDNVPTLLAQKTMFVRLENFTQQTTNAFQGNRSSIIAHIPRFDGQVQTGRIYHEPKNLIFLDLNNTEELNINSFDISFCYSNETYVQSLTGQSVVVLYIRAKPQERVQV
jgi:hypothetical protein